MADSRAKWKVIETFDTNITIYGPIAVYYNTDITQSTVGIIAFTQLEGDLFDVSAVFSGSINAGGPVCFSQGKNPAILDSLNPLALQEDDINQIHNQFKNLGFPQRNCCEILGSKLNGERLIEFIQLLNAVESIDPESLNHMMMLLKLKKPEETFVDEINILMDKGDIEEAWKKAVELQFEGYAEIIWQVAERFNEGHSKEFIPLLIEMYEYIAKVNPVYSEEALERLIILTGEKYSEPKDKVIRVETQFKIAMQMKGKDYQLISRLFTELCGIPLNNIINPFEPEGMLQLAGLMRALAAENQQLKAEAGKSSASTPSFFKRN